jgi:hypothetical protein
MKSEIGEIQRSPTPFERDDQEQRQVMASFFRTLQSHFGKWKDLFAGVKDPREAGKITYPLRVVLFTGVLLFICQLGSRRQIHHQLRGNGAVKQKYRALFGADEIPHGDTLNYAYQQVCVAEVQEVVCHLAEVLLGQSELADQRLFGLYHRVAIDGTGVLVFRERHCAYCLTRKLNNGLLQYYHPVLEAKLVTPNGYALSLMTEFIENTDPAASKQDCELKAFYRLAERLKKRFPHVPLCLLLDGLFAGGPTLAWCQKHDWKYLIGLTDTDLPSVNQEFEALLALPPQNQRDIRLDKGLRQTYRWINGIDYTDSENRSHSLNVLECVETSLGKSGKPVATKFKWLTNFTLLSSNSPTIANRAGRVRWKIENEGFNMQKHGGFGLEHVYSQDENAGKVFYLLLQIAWILFQLMTRSPFFQQAFPKGVGSLKNIAYRFLEAWRTLRLGEEELTLLWTGTLDTS